MPQEGLLAEPRLRAGLVGCGGRGGGAAENFINAAPNLEIVALGDMFEDRLKTCRDWLQGLGHPGVKISDEHCYTGFDAYKRVIDAGLDVVLFATPPGFRPLHFDAAIEAGKHVFLEKPVAVDPVGVRKIIETGKKAEAKNLAVVAGTHLRHQPTFIETIRQIHEGRIGRVVQGRAIYNVGLLWSRERKPEMSDMEWQLRNWYYFDWLCGDHIVEQHVHTIDVSNWVMGGPPASAVGVGGREVRTDEKFGNIYDHFAIDYEYPGGVHVLSTCRQMANCANYIGAIFQGTRGIADPYLGVIEGESPWKFPGKWPKTPHVQEQTDLVESIRRGKPLNHAARIAETTLTAIMGREAAYTGQAIRWEEMMASTLDLSPEKLEFGPNPVRPVPKPGQKRA